MSELRDQVARAEAAVIPRTYCTSCQRMQPRDGGVFKTMTTGHRRWMCASCTANRARARQ